MEAVAAPPLTAVVQTSVTPVPSVKITGPWGQPVEGVQVHFTVVRGGGEVRNNTAVTDASGIASVGEWMLGTVAGVNLLVASADGFRSVDFVTTAKPGPIAKIEPSFPIDQFGFPLTTIKPPMITVFDRFRNGIGGVPVTFTTGGSGLLQNVDLRTNNSGVAAVGTWTLGPQTGFNTATVRVEGFEGEVVFRARAIAREDAQVFRLDSITAGNKQWTPEGFYVMSAKFALGPDNLFFESIEWKLGGGTTSVSYVAGTVSGTNQELIFTGLGYRAVSARLEGPRLLIVREDQEFPGYLETWVYRRVMDEG
jgi:hypothetical protein